MIEGVNMDTIVKKFINEVSINFLFLEKYGFKKVEVEIENENFYPDSEVVIKYIGKSIGIEIYWYFAGANIGVTFFKLNNGEIPKKKVFFGKSMDAAEAISLYSLARYLDKWDSKLFLLDNVDNVTISKIKVRERIITDNMSGTVEGLSIAVKKLASNIIDGDTSIFNNVFDYQNKLINDKYF